MKKTLLFVLIALMCSVTLAFGISACNCNSTDNGGNGTEQGGNTQKPEDNKGDDGNNSTIHDSHTLERIDQKYATCEEDGNYVHYV